MTQLQRMIYDSPVCTATYWRNEIIERQSLLLIDELQGNNCREHNETIYRMYRVVENIEHFHSIEALREYNLWRSHATQI